MNNQVREVQVKAVLPLEGSFAVFLGTDEKTFVIYVDEPVGTAISMFMRGISKERPLTHDLLASVLMAFGGKVERVVINDVNGSVFYARLIISAENELGSRKVIELDARPSDSIAMAVQQGAPVYVADKVWQAVEDVSEALEQIEKRNLDANSNAAVEDPEDDDEDEDDEFTEDDLFEDEDEDDDEFDEEDEDEDEHRPGSSTF
jgi:bifunctional DNase/RNase